MSFSRKPDPTPSEKQIRDLIEATGKGAENALKMIADVFRTTPDVHLTGAEVAEIVDKAAKEWPQALRDAVANGDAVREAERIVREAKS
jgi:hypothetical protein